MSRIQMLSSVLHTRMKTVTQKPAQLGLSASFAGSRHNRHQLTAQNRDSGYRLMGGNARQVDAVVDLDGLLDSLARGNLRPEAAKGE